MIDNIPDQIVYPAGAEYRLGQNLEAQTKQKKLFIGDSSDDEREQSPMKMTPSFIVHDVVGHHQKPLQDAFIKVFLNKV